MDLSPFAAPLRGHDPTSPNPVDVRIPVYGRVVTDVQVLPEMVAFGFVEVGKAARKTLVVRSRSNTAFTVVSPSPGPLEVKLAAIEDVAGQSERIVDVALIGSGVGIRSATFLLKICPAGHEEYEVPVTFSYTGIQPDRSSQSTDNLVLGRELED